MADRNDPHSSNLRADRALRAPSSAPPPADRRGRPGRRPEPAPRRPRRRLVWRFAKWGIVVAVWCAVIAASVAFWYGHNLPAAVRLEPPTRKASVTLLAADGAVLATYGDLHAGAVGLRDVSPHVIEAIIATEDRRFFEHVGFDPIALARAVYVNWRAGALRQGGSTITQQVAKNVFLSPERTLRRKLQEMMLALWLEVRYSKEQILTLYLNRVYMGSGAYGVEAAARRYFAKKSIELTRAESAVIAGLPKAPSRYSPLNDPDAAWTRATVVLGAMVDAGFISEAEAAATARPRFVTPAVDSDVRYFTDWALDRAADYVGVGDRDLVIVTTLDARLQRAAEAAVEARIAAEGPRLDASQAALVALAPDGAVRAMVGGLDYRASQFNRATQGNRQPGSAFKLFVYLAALEAGLQPGDVFDDAPIDIAGWRPGNFDNRHRGAVTMREAVAASINTVAVRVSERVGRRRVIEAAARLGIASPIPAYPSLALGTSEVSLIELTGAYAALAAGGAGVLPHGLVEIRDGKGKVLYRRTGSGPGPVVGAREVTALNDMLAGVITSGTGRAAALGRPAAGKTGTTQDFRDAWFVGYTAELAAGVWVGNDDGGAMKGVTGGGLPARIWREFMAAALAGQPARPLLVRDAPVAGGAPPPARAVPASAPAPQPAAPRASPRITNDWINDNPALRE